MRKIQFQSWDSKPWETGTLPEAQQNVLLQKTKNLEENFTLSYLKGGKAGESFHLEVPLHTDQNYAFQNI